MSWVNLDSVLRQMEAFGIKLRPKDVSTFPKRLAKSVTCGQGGKYWYKVFEFVRGRHTYLVGSFGGYSTSVGWQKVEIDWEPPTPEEVERFKAEQAAARAAARAKAQEDADQAALGARDMWRAALPDGRSPYLDRKGLSAQAESCRYFRDGTLLLPMIRYDLPRDQALQAVQRILPDGRKFFTKGFIKPRCALRLGDVPSEPALILVCEGYATGLTIRWGIERRFPVFVAWDAGNLAHVVPMLRELYPFARLLVCADDDWKTLGYEGKPNNPGRTTALKTAREVPGCDLVWPVFSTATRQDKDTDFDDLRQRQGMHVVRRQLQGVIEAIGRKYG